MREDVHQADRDTPGYVTPEVKNHALRPERDPPPKELIRLHNARTRSKKTEDCGADSNSGDKHGRRATAKAGRKGK